MKKFLSLIIWATFLFSANFANAYTNFVNLGKKEFYYWIVFWEKENWRSIFLLKERNWRINQLFSSIKVWEIEKLFRLGDNVKILGQSYKNPNNHKYAWIFVNRIRNLNIPKSTYFHKKIKENKKLSEEQKDLIYYYLSSTNSRDKFLEWKKIFWNVNLKEIYKEMNQKNPEWKLNEEFLNLIKLFSLDEEFYKKWKKFKKIENITDNFKSLDQKFLSKINEKWFNEIKNIFYTRKARNNEEKFIYNELNNIDWFQDFLKRELSVQNWKDYELYDFDKIILYKTKKWRISFLYKNLKNLENIYAQKDSRVSVKDFYFKIKNKIIFKEIYKISMPNRDFETKILPEKVNNFLIKNNSEKIKKSAFSKDFQSKNFEWFKINFPQNFDYQEISIWNEKFSRIYLKNFYSNILSFDFNKVENFKNRIWERSEVKISWNYWQKITSDWKIFYQIKNKSWEKFEISFPTNEKNFKEIFESILNKIWN